jgi:glycosyltransferase involved in cell wall biosynthesis
MVRTLAARLDPAEFRMTACFLGEHGPWSDALRRAGVQVLEAKWPKPIDPAGACRFWSASRSHPVDVVHVHFGGRSVRHLARLATRARVLVHLHGRVRSESDTRLLDLRMDDVDAVIATSRAVANVVRAGRVRIVYPGVQIPRGIAQSDSWTIGAAGRLVPLKGYDRLIESFAELQKIEPRARLEIAGDGPARLELERQARALVPDGSVTFLGWSDDLPAAMARWSVFAQPSLEEAFGITILQAMASGLPVVASAVGGIPELVEDGVSGLLLPPGDTPALTTALAALLRDPVHRTKLADAARDRARDFSEERFAAGVANVYREVVGRRSA